MRLLLAVLVGCSLAPRALDLDGDGAWADDCDDADDDAYPGAEEACDGVDNDCDGIVDEDACGAMSTGDARFTVSGEDGLGPAVVTGHLDGDAFGDAVFQARFGDAPAICLVAGARLVEGVAGAPGSSPAITDVASCWIADGSLLGLAVTSAAPFGEPGKDVAWVLTDDDGLCAVDPFGDGLTLEAAAYGCSGLDAWGGGSGVSREILEFGTAAPDTATLMARTSEGLGFASIAALLDGPDAGWALTTTQPLVGIAGGRDLDGDGVADIVAVDGNDTFIVSSDFGLSAPIEIAGSHLDRSGEQPALTGAVEPGDLDGDGLEDWGLVAGWQVEMYSGTTWYSTVYDAGSAAAAGDFNGDHVADLVVGTSASGVAVFLGPLPGGGSPAAEVRIASGVSTFAAGMASVDVDEDGLTDVWVTDPGVGETEDTGFDPVADGTAYLFSGFAIDR